ncbi:MAG: hypothetical protein R2824_18015 [Saprospiraceae bacterium]
MTELFGTATGSDNCPGYTVTEEAPDVEGLDDCGYGCHHPCIQRI